MNEPHESIRRDLERDADLHEAPWWNSAILDGWSWYFSRLLCHVLLSHPRLNRVGPLVRLDWRHRWDHKRQDDDPWDLGQEAEALRRGLAAEKIRKEQ